MVWAEDPCAAVARAFGRHAEREGLVVGVAALDETGTRTYLSDGCPEDGRFEIGSVTKTMTATLLACLVEDGAVGLDDGIGRFLDAGPNAEVTLRELATHTSGLPTLGPDLEARRPARSRTTIAMRREEVEEVLRHARRDPGAGFAYSNLNYQLLGIALERAAAVPYAALLERRLLAPLSMRCSGVGARAGGPLVPGHARNRPVARVVRPLPAAGGVEASLGDLARYLRACLDPPEGLLGAALRRVQRSQGVRRDARREVGLGWMVRDGGSVVSHTGSTRGFSTAVAVDRDRRNGLAIVHNRAGGSMALGAAALVILSELGGRRGVTDAG